jgi:membrane fusion protein (multidrug efflux system)
LTLSVKPDALWVAEEALVPEAGKQYVFRVVDQGEGRPKTVERVEVTTGLRRPGEVELTSGVAAGDLVVVAGVIKLRQGTPVTLLPGPDATRPGKPSGATLPTARTVNGSPPRG